MFKRNFYGCVVASLVCLSADCPLLQLLMVVGENLKNFVISPLPIHGGMLMQQLFTFIRLLTFIFARPIHDFSSDM